MSRSGFLVCYFLFRVAGSRCSVREIVRSVLINKDDFKILSPSLATHVFWYIRLPSILNSLLLRCRNHVCRSSVRGTSISKLPSGYKAQGNFLSLLLIFLATTLNLNS